MNSQAPGPIRAVVFDVFGTLVAIQNPRRPYLKLMRWLREQGRRPRADDSTRLMCESVGLAGAARMFGFDVPASILTPWEQELAAELAGITLFDDVIPTLVALRERGLKLGLCSNAAQPYAAPVLAQLPFLLDVYAWSFSVGAIKPDERIYRYLCDTLACSPHEILFIGDTLEADVLGPTRFGMQARLLVRELKVSERGSIASRADLLRPHF